MPSGKGTYGSQKGRPPVDMKKKYKGKKFTPLIGRGTDEERANTRDFANDLEANRKAKNKKRIEGLKNLLPKKKGEGAKKKVLPKKKGEGAKKKKDDFPRVKVRTTSAAKKVKAAAKKVAEFVIPLKAGRDARDRMKERKKKMKARK